MATMPVDKGFYVTSGFGARWGTTHWGTDFGRDGGSGGFPVYAVKSGTVTRSGPASGFGQWVTVDHPATVGGGLSVYGHIIPEVGVGTRVSEGQRIGRINPNSATNGGVAPHLHFEFHRYVWSPPGGDRLDPMTTVLKGAKWRGEPTTNKPKETTMTTTQYGVDISNHQDGISCKQIAREGFKFCIIKATEGTWLDPIFESHLQDSLSAGLLTAAYVYVRGETTPLQHAEALHKQLKGRKNIPVCLDIENNSGTNPDHWRNIVKAIEKRGYRVILTYTGRWYWQQVGQPSLAGLPPLWNSNYPTTNKLTASEKYVAVGGKNGPGWQGYGGLNVVVWQFTESALVAGRRIDANAFRGTEAQLKELFTGEPAKPNTPKPSPEKTEELLMGIEKITSLINPTKKFKPGFLLALIDRATWENRVLLRAVLKKMGENPDKIIADAIAKDNEGNKK